MKRCPLCDFIYEDDQGVCDMDGFELVHERGASPSAGKDTALKSPASVEAPRRRHSLYILLGFGLGAAVFSTYYTSNQAAAPAVGPHPASYNTRPAPAAAEPIAAPVPPTPATPPAEMHEPAAEETTPPPAPAPTTQPRAAKPEAKKPRPAGKKKDSKLASILNKTGRMLKKPFGF